MVAEFQGHLIPPDLDNYVMHHPIKYAFRWKRHFISTDSKNLTSDPFLSFVPIIMSLK